MVEGIITRTLEYLNRSWDTKPGCLVALLLIAGLTIFVAPQGHKLQIGIPAGVAWLLFWLLKRGGFILTRKRVVVFCLQCESGTEQYLDKTIRALKEDLQDLGLERSVMVRRIGSDLVTDEASALRYATKNSVSMLTSGRFEVATHAGVPICSLRNLRWTGTIAGSKDWVSVMTKDINLLVRDKRWAVRTDETYLDAPMLGRDFSELMLFVLAVCSLAERQYQDAYRLANRLLTMLTQIDSSDASHHIVQFIKRVRELMYGVQVVGGYSAYHDGKLEAAITYFEGAQKMGFEHPVPTIMLAWLHYKTGNELEARKYTEGLVRRWPNNAVTLLNEAFFAVRDKRYDYAVEVYQRLLKLPQLDAEVLVTSEVYAVEHEQHPHELAYLFGLGFVSFRFCDETLGRQDLRKFIDATRDKYEYRRMRQFALDIVNQPKDSGKLKRRRKRK